MLETITLGELMKNHATRIEGYPRRSIGAGKLAKLINFRYGQGYAIASEGTIRNHIPDKNGVTRSRIISGESYRWLVIAAVLFKLSQNEANALLLTKGAPNLEGLRSLLNSETDRQRIWGSGLWPRLEPAEISGNLADQDSTTIQKLVEIEPNLHPTEGSIIAVRRSVERLTAQVQHYLHQGFWEHQADQQHDVEALLRALSGELNPFVDRPPSISVVQTYGARLSQYLVEIEQTELVRAGHIEPAKDAATFGDEILAGLEDPTDIDSAYAGADWIVRHLKATPKFDEYPREKPPTAVARTLGWINQARDLTATGSDISGVTSLIGGGFGLVLAGSFGLDPTSGAIVGGLGGLLLTVIGFVMAMLKANFRSTETLDDIEE